MLEKIKKSFKTYYQREVIRTTKVWFLDIPKTSTTSIRVELGNKYGSVYNKSNVRFSIPAHTTSTEMIEFLGPGIWENIFTFSIVRNPWDKTLSFFLWAQKNGFFLK